MCSAYWLRSSEPRRPCCLNNFSDNAVKPETSTKPMAPSKSSLRASVGGAGSDSRAARRTISAGE
eukprot:2453521-Pleurochrysis_carterae.AAC.1